VALSSATFTPSQQTTASNTRPVTLKFSTSGQLSVHNEHLFAYHGPRKSPPTKPFTRDKDLRENSKPRENSNNTPQKCLQPHHTAPPPRAMPQTTPTISATRYTAPSPAAQPISRRADHALHLQVPRPHQTLQRSAQARSLQTLLLPQTAHSAAKP